MKSGEKPKFEKDWWIKNKAKALASDMTLDNALAAFETPFKAFKANPVDKGAELTKTFAALNNLPAAIAATIKKCNSVLNKETIECLKKFDPLIKTLQRDMKSELNRRAQIEKLTLDDCLFGALKDKFAALAKARYVSNDFNFLTACKGGKVGTAKEFTRFIAPGSPEEINIAATERVKFSALAGKGPKIVAAMPKDWYAKESKTPRKDLSNAPWKAAYDEMYKVMKQNMLLTFKQELRKEEHMLATLR